MTLLGLLLKIVVTVYVGFVMIQGILGLLFSVFAVLAMILWTAHEVKVAPLMEDID